VTKGNKILLAVVVAIVVLFLLFMFPLYNSGSVTYNHP
jgi:uncharacterized integral membrane protein